MLSPIKLSIIFTSSNEEKSNCINSAFPRFDWLTEKKDFLLFKERVDELINRNAPSLILITNT